MSNARTIGVAVALAAALGGALVAIHYHRLGLTLSHYDARGHLVVARRIADSITPGWQQIGAVWLPLPHLLNAVPVQVDSWYRTGGSAVAISIAAFAIAAGSLAWMIVVLTDSAVAAVAGSAVFVLNPNVLYLQATPLSEPLLLGTSVFAVALLLRWSAADRTADLKIRPTSTQTVGGAFALACLTRYEAWPVTALRWRVPCGRDGAPATRGRTLLCRCGHRANPRRHHRRFAVFSRVVIGEWLVPSGFHSRKRCARASWISVSQSPGVSHP